MKIFAAIFAVVFALFAAVQLNDPDPEIWTPIYLYGSVLSGLVFFRRYIPIMILGGVIGYFCGAVYIFTPDVFGTWIDEEMLNRSTGMKNATMEEGREFWGLVICFLVSTRYLFHAISRKKIGFG